MGHIYKSNNEFLGGITSQTSFASHLLPDLTCLWQVNAIQTTWSFHRVPIMHRKLLHFLPFLGRIDCGGSGLGSSSAILPPVSIISFWASVTIRASSHPFRLAKFLALDFTENFAS